MCLRGLTEICFTLSVVCVEGYQEQSVVQATDGAFTTVGDQTTRVNVINSDTYTNADNTGIYPSFYWTDMGMIFLKKKKSF